MKYKKRRLPMQKWLFCWIKIVQHIKIQYLFYIYFYLSLVYVGIQCRQHNHGQFTHEMISHAWQKCLVSMYSCLQSNKSFLHWKSSLFIFHIDNFLTIDWYFYWVSSGCCVFLYVALFLFNKKVYILMRKNLFLFTLF
jgi:magnesium-transporting ATPase (P-type)